MFGDAVGLLVLIIAAVFLFMIHMVFGFSVGGFSVDFIVIVCFKLPV